MLEKIANTATRLFEKLTNAGGNHMTPAVVLSIDGQAFGTKTMSRIIDVTVDDKRGFEADELEDLKGLNKRSPWFAGIMLMLMFSMAGVPFFIGFFAKFSVLQAVVAAGYMWLAIVAVLFSLIGAFYYLRVVKLMYFDAPVDEAPLSAALDMRILISANGLAVAFLGLFPQVIMSLCAYALLRSL